VENVIHLYKKDDNYVLYDTEQMQFFSLSSKIGNYIEQLEEGEKNIFLTEAFKEKFTSRVRWNYNDQICTRLVLVITQTCNLACKYCYAEEGTYGQKGNNFMDFETATNSLKFFIEVFPLGISSIQFFGGEPTLDLELIEKICVWCKEYFPEKNLKVPIFTMSTNGTLIDQKAIDIFNKYHIQITISIDGDKYLNDYHRMYKGTNYSVHDKIVETINHMNKIREFSLSVEMTVTKKHIEKFRMDGYILSIPNYIHSLGIDSVHLVPVVADSHSDLALDSSDNDALRKYFDCFAKYTLDTALTHNPLHMTKSLEIVKQIKDGVKKKNSCFAGVTNFSVNVCGDIYPCFMLIGKNDDLIMGNVNQYKSGKIEDFKHKMTIFKEIAFDNIAECKQCWAKGICTNCIATSYLTYKDFYHTNSNICNVQKELIERIGLNLSKL